MGVGFHGFYELAARFFTGDAAVAEVFLTAGDQRTFRRGVGFAGPRCAPIALQADGGG
jgi:hypothetical protein